MASYNFTRLRRLMLIYRVVQVVLLGLLLFMAFNFQRLFTLMGVPALFMQSIVAAIAFQLVMLYPAWLLARRDVAVEIESSQIGLTGDQMLALRRRRLVGDLWKLCVMGFFIVFIVLAPDVTKTRAMSSVLAATYFGFLLISITYFQCFNFLARRTQREHAGGQ